MYIFVYHVCNYPHPFAHRSVGEPNKRSALTCSIGEHNNRPEFIITTTVKNENGEEVEREFKAETAKKVWYQVLDIIERGRKEADLVIHCLIMTFLTTFWVKNKFRI